MPSFGEPRKLITMFWSHATRKISTLIGMAFACPIRCNYKQSPLDPSAARIVAYRDGLYPNGHLRQAKVNALPALCFSGRLQSASGEELRPFVGRTLMPGIFVKSSKVNCGGEAQH